MKKIALSIICLFFGQIISQSDPDPSRFKYGRDGDEVYIDQFINWDQKNTHTDNGILFVGSSSIRKWPTSKYFNYKSIINRGFGGSHISDVNYYFNSIVDKYIPKIIVLYAGDNDIAGNKTPEQVLEDYKEFSSLVSIKLPKAKIIFIPIKPSPARWSIWSKMRKANKLIEIYIDSDTAQFYVDTSTPMLNENGKPSGDLFVSDSLHLSVKGYDLWSKILKPTLDSLVMKDRIKIFGW